MLALWMPIFAAGLLAAQPELRSVEQGFEDVSPLARSTRHDNKDLRRPTGFEKVYEFTTPDGKRAFVRVDNGIAAVFSRSDYAPSGQALFPPDMVFHIGTAGFFEAATRPEITPAHAPNRLDTRVPAAAAGQVSPEPRPTAIPGPPAIVTNEIYRRFRIAQLLQSALQAE